MWLTRKNISIIWHLERKRKKKLKNEMVHMVSGHLVDHYTADAPCAQQTDSRNEGKKTTECFHLKCIAINDVCGLVDDCIINMNINEYRCELIFRSYGNGAVFASHVTDQSYYEHHLHFTHAVVRMLHKWRN